MQPNQRQRQHAPSIVALEPTGFQMIDHQRHFLTKVGHDLRFLQRNDIWRRQSQLRQHVDDALKRKLNIAAIIDSFLAPAATAQQVGNMSTQLG